MSDASPMIAIRQPTVSRRAALYDRLEDGRVLMVQLGFFPEDVPVTIDELRAWWDNLLAELIRMPQPVTYTSEATTRLIKALFDTDPNSPVNRMNVPHDFALFPRVQLSLTHVAAGLQATLPMRAIVDDVDGVAAPTTELGKTSSSVDSATRSPHGLRLARDTVTPLAILKMLRGH